MKALLKGAPEGDLMISVPDTTVSVRLDGGEIWVLLNSGHKVRLGPLDDLLVKGKRNDRRRPDRGAEAV